MENGKPVIEVSALSVRRRKPILEGINWRVEPGEHWCMLGANGSGKTTLLNCLTAYFSPSSGTISVCGRRYGRYDWRELRKKIGIVSSYLTQKIQRPLTAFQIVLSGKDALLSYCHEPTDYDRRKAMEIMRQIECDHLRDNSWLDLSQGERQRVLIGRALMSDLRLLILDEPCAGLDPVAREKLLRFIDRLGRQPNCPSIVLVTHHVEEIMPIFSHVLILKQGRVLASGEKADILTVENLSAAFNAEVRLSRHNGRYSMSINLDD